MQGRVIGAVSQLVQQCRRALVRSGGGNGEGQRLPPSGTHPLSRQKLPLFAQRTAPVVILRILPIPGLKFNLSGAGAQVELVRMPMHQPSLALGGKPRRVDRPVVGVFLASAAASILGPRPTPRLQFATTTG